VLTVGVDLAAEPERTAVARIAWSRGRAVIEDVIWGAGDDLVLDAVGRAGKAGIDCPLGWPDAFVDFVAAHRAGHVTVPQDVTGRDWRRSLAMRRTDRVVAQETGLTLLSVSADRIGSAMSRCDAPACSRGSRGRAMSWTGAAVAWWWRFIRRPR
jgi:Protein of unknown function (DUF429)